MLLEQDFDTHIYPEIIAAIQRAETGILAKAIQASIQQVQGYMSRFDVQTMFAATENSRDTLLLMYLKDIATWHFIVLGNPNMNVEFCELRYNQARKDLKDIQSGSMTPGGWLHEAGAEGAGSIISVTSAPRRATQY